MRGYKRGQDEERHSRVAEVCLIDLDRRGDLVEFDVPCDHARYASCGEREGKEGGKVGIDNAVCSPTLRFRDNRVRIHSLPPPAPPPEDEIDPDDPMLTVPLPRYNAMLAVLRNTLYMYVPGFSAPRDLALTAGRIFVRAATGGSSRRARASTRWTTSTCSRSTSSTGTCA